MYGQLKSHLSSGFGSGVFTPGILLVYRLKSKAKEIILRNNSCWYKQK